MIYLSSVYIFFFVLILMNKIKTKLVAASISVVFFSLLFVSGVFLFSDYLTGNGIDESIYFHWKLGLSGAGLEDFSGFITLYVCYVVFISALSFSVFKIVYLNAPEASPSGRISYGLASVMAFLAFYFNPVFSDVISFSSVEGHKVPISDYSDEYFSNKNFNLNNKNIVFIYLESFERTYLDELFFPSLAPNLNRIEKQAVSFSDIRQIYGAGWTIAGMVNSQCGIPLVTPGGGNSMSGVDEFLPGATCIGDVLKENGYTLNYLGGSSLDFAGKGNFYKSHGFSRIDGLRKLRTGLKDANYYNSWGLYDDSLFELIKIRFDELAAGGEPFGLFALTLDTHHPRGNKSSGCAEFEYEDGSNPILNAIHCADKMVADLIEHIQRSQVYDDTIIVISSDHLAQRNSAHEQLRGRERRNLLLILGGGIQPKMVDNVGALIDVAPMVLDVLGADIDGFGFGRNLLKNKESLTESVSNVNDFLSSNREFYSDLWYFPQVRDGLIFDFNDGDIKLGRRTVSYPAIFYLDESLNVDEMVFLDIYLAKSLLDYVVESSFDRRFILIDECVIASKLVGSEKGYGSKYCVIYGAMGLDELQVKEVFDGAEIYFNDINKFFESASFNRMTSLLRVKSVRAR